MVHIGSLNIVSVLVSVPVCKRLLPLIYITASQRKRGTQLIMYSILGIKSRDACLGASTIGSATMIKIRCNKVIKAVCPLIAYSAAMVDGRK